ncbi:MAG: hypothetical protein ACRBI6_08330 [Acidimicrobiales bacterium]
METNGQPTYLIWARDTSRSSRRWVVWCSVAAAALCGFGAFAAYMAEDPGQISTFLGLGAILIGLLWSIPAIYDWTKRRNPEIHTVGRELVWSKKRVPIDAVETFEVRENVTHGYNGTTHYRMAVTICEFSLIDGSKEAFAFPNLPGDERATLAGSLDQILPGRRVQHGAL